MDYVVTGASPRAIETAIAMGYAVDDAIDMPSGYVPHEVDHHDQWSWPQPYVAYAELIKSGGGLAAVAQAHQEIWAGVVAAVPDGGGALVVSHGGCIEPALASCLPDEDHASWGAPFAHCDGARLDFSNGRFSNLRLRRASTSSA